MAAQDNSGQASAKEPLSEKRSEHHTGKKSAIDKIRENPLFLDAVLLVLIIAIVGGFFYWQDMQGKVFIEKATISAPVISITPASYGQIDKFYVEEGDLVSQGQRLVEVGGQIIESKTEGLIIYIKDTPGQMSGPSDTLVKMIDPREMRVVGRIQEDKGFADIKTGQKVKFTVDAFPGKTYEGIIDFVANSAREGDMVFSISDKREVKEFEVKALFDTRAYPELKNGMSAKMWVYK